MTQEALSLWMWQSGSQWDLYLASYAARPGYIRPQHGGLENSPDLAIRAMSDELRINSTNRTMDTLKAEAMVLSPRSNAF